GAANAQSPATCGNFQVTLELNHIEYLDDGEEGVSAGDRRVGRFDIFSTSGEPAGDYFFASTTLPDSDTDGFREIGTARYSFENGTVAVSTFYTLADPSNTDRTVTQEFNYPVMGGTGDFVGASGNVHSAPGSDGLRLHTFDLACDG
ncbi:MAG: hypothetical protein AAF414_23140, partial [Pseudomonadota bacterium]